MRQNLFTIAPDAPFLPTLAAHIVDGTLLAGWSRDTPFWLTNVTVLLPTRRACAALAEAFRPFRLGLLPDIRALGDQDEEAAPFLPPIDMPPDPAAMPAPVRRLILARLVAHWAKQPGTSGFATPPSPAETFRLADSLGTLIDDLIIERVAPDALRAIAPENLAANWQQTLDFLEIALTRWPEILAAYGTVDPATLRNRRLERQAETLSVLYGDRPVIAAGSTGSQAATADLLRAIARLDRGSIVLPGLDASLSVADLATLADAARSPHAHPQYGVVRLLAQLGARPDAVTELAPQPRPTRTRIVRRALALADGTARWTQDRARLAPAFADALAGVAVLAAPGEEIEARAIAIAARGALQQGKSVGIVSPDRNLARRIAAELQRFDIAVDDAAGTPLFQSPASRLVRALLTVASERFAAVQLMALLRNRATTLSTSRAETSRLADLIELGLLRGQPPATGLAGLRRALEANRAGTLDHPRRRLTADDYVAVAALLDRLEAALAPLCALLTTPLIDVPRLADALRTAFLAVAAVDHGEPAPLIGREAFLDWAGVHAVAADAGPVFPALGLDSLLAALMTGREVRAARPVRSDIAIWGRLEARLLRADVTILAGLNEDVWPEPADPGPWLGRGMRLAAGLEPPERRQGQAAHDFEMAIGGGEVLLAFASRRGTSPALPSPLLQRLDAFIGARHAKILRAAGQGWIDAARRIDDAPPPEPARRPAPRPALALRPRQLSVTEIETLVRSPYDLYARHVLRLIPLAPLGEAPGARERGTVIHQVFAKFVVEHGDFDAPDAPLRLRRLAEEAFATLDTIPEQQAIWLRRFERAAEQFLAFERARSPEIAERHAEAEGLWTWPNGFRLSGRADRIDLRHDGRFEIIDYKTGSVPDRTAMQLFLAPQLPLEAAMVDADAFPSLKSRTAEALSYIKVGLGPEAFLPRPYAGPDGMSLADAIVAVSRSAQGHVDALLLHDDLPLLPRVLPDVKRRYAGPYEHLARLGEWLRIEPDDEL